MARTLWTQYRKRPVGIVALAILSILILLAIYAPLFTSSKPLLVRYDGTLYFPLARYLLFKGYYTKAIDLFFNLLMFTIPLALFSACFPWRKWGLLGATCLQFGAFWFFMSHPIPDPARVSQHGQSWEEELAAHNPYARLHLTLRHHLDRADHEALVAQGVLTPNSRWKAHQERVESRRAQLRGDPLQALNEKEAWLQAQEGKLETLIVPLFRSVHWEERAFATPTEAHWWQRNRIIGKDLLAALIFGIRVSIVVGVIATALALLVGLPLGAIAGFWGGKLDIILCRLVEIWEGMPTFLMLLLTVAILQNRSIFLIIGALALFSWPPLCRMVRAEVLRQKALPYVQACKAQGYPTRSLLFSQILPNAIPPVLSLLPFSLMVAITSEAGLAFLGLGESGSCSLGVLMDEGRAAFPADSGLLWPPAILLSTLLIAIALVGDTLRDALDPKLRID